MQARFKGVAVAVSIPDDVPRVAADERRLSQVLVNVLLNAGDAMGGMATFNVTSIKMVGSSCS